MSKALKISNWIFDYAQSANMSSLTVGCSGGIDSSLVSTLCAMTGIKTYCVLLPINQNPLHTELGKKHIEWLQGIFPNVELVEFNLSDVFNSFYSSIIGFESELGFSNSKARLRMTALYQIAASTNGLVVSTGNRVEDGGVGFFTKWGDGAADISPIGDLYKSEVRKMAKELGVMNEIISAAPTDGLWPDGRTDEDQIGCTYDELEDVMKGTSTNQKAIEIYNKLHNKNLHKMLPIPVCKL